ncbi:hypothetical protein CRUP_034256 [Coryphaenoides rupestris]|nr:hypothetical protein CRUP_034256 [Coryphaenoides rupestris]
MSSYLYIVKYELPIVIESFLGTKNGIILPLSLLRNLGYLGYTSGFSLLCMVFFLIVFPSSPSPFVCHPGRSLPMYVGELKDRSRKKMQGVANVSFLAMFIMYLLAALFGYLTFNAHVEPELLHTYSRVENSDMTLLVVRLAVLTAVTLTVPVVLFPVSASAAAMLIFILPSAFYIKLVKKESMKSVQKIGATIFLISGILVMFSSLALIILEWIHTATTAGSNSPNNKH